MASTQGPKITEVKILVQPPENVEVNKPFKFPVIVMAKARGLKTSVPSIGVVLWNAGSIPITADPPRVSNALQPADTTRRFLCHEMDPPAEGNGQLDPGKEYTLYYRIDGLSVTELGTYFMLVTCCVPIPGSSPDKPEIKKTQSTRGFNVQTANERASFNAAFKDTIEKLADGHVDKLTKDDVEIIQFLGEKLSKKEECWLQRLGVDIK